MISQKQAEYDPIAGELLAVYRRGVPEDQRAEHALDVINPARRLIAWRALGELQRHQRLSGQRDPGHDRVHMADQGRLETGVRRGEQRDADRRGTADVGNPAV